MLKNKTLLYVYIKFISFYVNYVYDDIYKTIVKDIETRFNTSNYELDKLLSNWKNKKVIGLTKDELGWKLIKEFVGLRAKTYSYLTDGGSEDKKESAQKSVL